MYFISRTSNSKYKQKVIKIEGKQLISYVLGTFFFTVKRKKSYQGTQRTKRYPSTNAAFK
jgi:hypothetical protein